MAKITWVDVGGGAQQSTDARFYLSVERRYCGRKAGRPVTTTTVTLHDRQGQATADFTTVRLAKAAAEARA
jgi:ribosomal protein L35AE/L33A